MIGNVIVALIVVAAFVHAATRFLPAGWRQKIVYALTRHGARQSRMAKWFNTESSCGGGCDACKACAPADGAPADAAPPAGAHRVIKLHRE